MEHTKKTSVQSLDALQRDLTAKRGLGIPWRDIARQYPGVPAGTLCAISKGREPKRPAIRAALGLPVTAPAPVCAVHGVVHVAKRCPAVRVRRGWLDWPVGELAALVRKAVSP